MIPVISIRSKDIQDVVALMFQHPVISAYIELANPVGDAVISNVCYTIRYADLEAVNRGQKTTISVFLNPAYTEDNKIEKKV